MTIHNKTTAPKQPSLTRALPWLICLFTLIGINTTPGYSTIVESPDDDFFNDIPDEHMLLETQRPKPKKPRPAPAPPKQQPAEPKIAEPEEVEELPEPKKPKFITDQINIFRQAHAKPIYINILWIFDREYHGDNSKLAPFHLMRHIINELAARDHNIKLKMTLVSKGLSSDQSNKLDDINDLFKKNFGSKLSVHNVTYNHIYKYVTLDGGMKYLMDSTNEGKSGFDQLFKHSAQDKSKLQKNIVVFITKEEAKRYPKPRRGGFFGVLKFVLGGLAAVATGGLAIAILIGGTMGALIDHSMWVNSRAGGKSVEKRTKDYEWQISCGRNCKYKPRSPANAALLALQYLFRNQPYEVWSIVGGAPTKSYLENFTARVSSWKLQEDGEDQLKLVRSDLDEDEDGLQHFYKITDINARSRKYHQTIPMSADNMNQRGRWNYQRGLCIIEGRLCEQYPDRKLMNEAADCDGSGDTDVANRYANYRGPNSNPILRGGMLVRSQSLSQVLCVVNHYNEKNLILTDLLKPELNIDRLEEAPGLSDSDKEYHFVDLIKVGGQTLLATQNSNNLYYKPGDDLIKENLLGGYGICKDNRNRNLQPGYFRSFVKDNQIHPLPECIELTYEPPRGEDPGCKKRTGRKYLEIARKTRGLSMTPCAAQALDTKATTTIGKHLTTAKVLTWAASTRITLSNKADKIDKITVTKEGQTKPLPNSVKTYLNDALAGDLAGCPIFIKHVYSKTHINLWFDKSTYYKHAITIKDDNLDDSNRGREFDNAQDCFNNYATKLEHLFEQYDQESECVEGGKYKCLVNITYQIKEED